MRKQHSEPDDHFGLHDTQVARDMTAIFAIGDKFNREQAERAKMIDEQLAMGWGRTPQDKIPADWRTRRGPETEEQQALFRECGYRNRGRAKKKKNEPTN